MTRDDLQLRISLNISTTFMNSMDNAWYISYENTISIFTMKLHIGLLIGGMFYSARVSRTYGP